MIVVAVAVVLALAGADPAAAAKIDPVREKQELRLVEILHTMNDKPPTDQKAREALMSEYQGLLFSLADVDPNTVKTLPPAQAEAAQQKVAAVQGEVLNRRDPPLAKKMLHDFQLYACKSKQTEAKANLRGIVVGENAYAAEKDGFSKDLSAVVGTLDTKRYTLAVVDVKKGHFLARATGISEQAGDVWEVDESGTPKNTADLCSKIP